MKALLPILGVGILLTGSIGLLSGRMENGESAPVIPTEESVQEPKEQEGTEAIPTPSETQSEKEIRTISLLATNWRFDPEEIVVRKGERIRLVVKGEWSDHGFALPAFDIDRHVREGDTETVEFVADKMGEFPFSCTVYCGTGHKGMSGVLRVEE